MTFELLELGREEEEELLASATIEAGRYTQMRITVTEVKIAIDGQTVDEPVKLPSGELKFLKPVAFDFDVQSSDTTVLLLDFAARDSLTSTSQGMYMFNPVVTPSLVQ
jgi:hypothetical protein